MISRRSSTERVDPRRDARSTLEVVCSAAGVALIDMIDPSAVDGVEWSEGVYEALGRDPGHGPLSLQGLCREHAHPSDRQDLLDAIEQATATGDDLAREFRATRGNGDAAVLEVRLRSRRREGEVVGWLAVLRDRTDERRRAATRDRVRKMEAVTRLTAGVAHEYNNLLMGIRGCADLACRRLDSRHPAHALLAEARRSAERGARLTERLLELGRQRSQQSGLVSVDGTIERTAHALRALAGKGVSLETRLGASRWRVVGHEGEVEQMLVHLVVNAREAMRGGGRIDISTAEVSLDAEAVAAHGLDVPPGDYVWLRVADTGVGMDEETRERAFEPFFTTKRSRSRAGLGLSVVYSLVRPMGDVAAISEPGVGTTFLLALPRCDEDQDDRVTGVVRSDPRRGSERILVVDDEALILLTLASQLTSLGYTVDQATSLFEVAHRLEATEGPYDLVISDVMLPSGTGLDVRAMIESAWPGVPIVFMSAYPRELLGAGLRISKDARLLQKPFEEPELHQVLRATLGRSPLSLVPPDPGAVG